MIWTYTVDKGLTNLESGISLMFGSPRDVVRLLLDYDVSINKGRFDREDSYKGIGDSKDWIRLNFDDGQKLSEIELISGSVSFNGIQIELDGKYNETTQELRAKGMNLIEDDYGCVCSESKFSIGESSRSGGADNKISWFYTSIDVSHLLE